MIKQVSYSPHGHDIVFSQTNRQKGIHSMTCLEEAIPLQCVVGRRKRGGEHFGYGLNWRLSFIVADCRTGL